MRARVTHVASTRQPGCTGRKPRAARHAGIACPGCARRVVSVL
ncbi:hypothetical protein P355_3043 [Burkholderia cenocepacia KC-01]|nr:hypothetical protein P355_3043 [Burkholderia cenocepacia KC-01]